MTKSMKRYLWMVPVVLVTLIGVAVFGTLRSRAASEELNGGPRALDVTLGQATRGIAFYTAAVNADGTLASCFANGNPCTATSFGAGAYQVDFGTNVQANNGYSRWVQPDTLTTGTVSTFCDTADRAGDVNGVFINCQNAAGTGTNTSFFLFVGR